MGEADAPCAICIPDYSIGLIDGVQGPPLVCSSRESSGLAGRLWVTGIYWNGLLFFWLRP